MKAVAIIKSLINVVGTSIGVVLIAVGAVMLINATLKLTVFQLESSPHFEAYRCDQYIEMDHGMFPANEKSEMTKLTPQQREKKYTECIVREQKREKKRFSNEKKHNLIDGTALLLVGIPLFVFYMRRSMKS